MREILDDDLCRLLWVLLLWMLSCLKKQLFSIAFAPAFLSFLSYFPNIEKIHTRVYERSAAK